MKKLHRYMEVQSCPLYGHTRPESCFRGVMSPPPSILWRVMRWLRNHKWNMAFWAWMALGVPACTIGGAWAGVALFHWLRGF